jgi:hypothetical protein
MRSSNPAENQPVLLRSEVGTLDPLENSARFKRKEPSAHSSADLLAPDEHPPDRVHPRPGCDSNCGSGDQQLTDASTALAAAINVQMKFFERIRTPGPSAPAAVQTSRPFQVTSTTCWSAVRTGG